MYFVQDVLENVEIYGRCQSLFKTNCSFQKGSKQAFHVASKSNIVIISSKNLVTDNVFNLSPIIKHFLKHYYYYYKKASHYL